jgi:acetyl esterase/lipase
MQLLPPKSALTFLGAAADVTLRRWKHGPLRPSWTWVFETMVTFMKRDTERVSRLPPKEQRAHMERLPAPPSEAARRVRREKVDAGGVPGEWFIPDEVTSDAVGLYLHGGSFVFGSTRTHGDLIGRMALAAGMKVLGLNYRLAPEHPFPAQLEDVRATWRWLLSTGVAPSRCVFSGDSAGGGLALSAMLALRDAGEPLPAGGVLLSPWVDVSCPGKSQLENEPYDWGNQAMLREWARLFLGGHDPADPLASPVKADLTGLPRLYIQLGKAELVRDDVSGFVDKARASGVTAELELWDDMVHLFQSYGSLFPLSLKATVMLGRKLRELGSGSEVRAKTG